MLAKKSVMRLAKQMESLKMDSLLMFVFVSAILSEGQLRLILREEKLRLKALKLSQEL